MLKNSDKVKINNKNSYTNNIHLFQYDFYFAKIHFFSKTEYRHQSFFIDKKFESGHFSRLVGRSYEALRSENVVQPKQFLSMS